MTLPDHTTPVDRPCPRCWAVFRVPGAVFAICDAAGTVLYSRCALGHRLDAGDWQPDLFTGDR